MMPPPLPRLTSPEKEYKPGEIVKDSGIYRITHDTDIGPHEPHEVTAVEGEQFPPCRHCRHPRYVLDRAAIHMHKHPNLKAQQGHPAAKKITKFVAVPIPPPPGPKR